VASAGHILGILLDSVSNSKGSGPSTAPPPFDPEQYAKDSDALVRVASETLKTTQLATPPLNKRVRVAADTEEDLEWFDLSADARALLARIDGTKTLLELMEGNPSTELLRAVAELHDAKLLVYEG
jgi:hypothetical protein